MRLAALGFFLALAARAEVSLPSVLGSHMVVQRGLPVHVWGKAAAGEGVSVTFRGETRSTATDSIGMWSLYLKAGEAGGPYDLTIQGANAINLTDILVGDVWVASGQSNMEFGMKNVMNSATELAAANRPRIRLFHVKNKVADYPLADLEAWPWEAATPESVKDFSAVAYFFARDLQDRLDVPIGLIDSSWGGTPADSWTSLRALSADASLMPVFAQWALMTDDLAVARIRREQELEKWRRASEEAKAKGVAGPGFPWRSNDSHEWSPAGLYNAMIAPLTPFPIRGAIWYQGESNASRERAPLYCRLFEAMIEDWRRAWGVGDFPFLFVQLANFKTGPDSHWPDLREAQRQTLELRNTGMAVTIDIGNPTDIHPKNKQEVGRRLALAARAIAFGEQIEYSGPVFLEAIPEDSALRVSFTHAGSGLAAHGDALKGFEVAGADGKYVPADARIDGSAVLVSAPSVDKPVSVRYGWSDDPQCNLYNGDGLPASPFRSSK
jgi:sialate O-acetylesterase